MSDRVLLTNVAVEALVGVHDHERLAKRPLLVDLEVACDLDRAATTDELTDSVDYSALIGRVRSRCAASSYKLIEALAGEIARACFEDPRVEGVKVTVRKPGAVPDAEVAVSLERRR